MAKLGRPQITVNWKAVDAMCMHHATHREISCFLGISEDTLSRAALRDHETTFAAYCEQKRLAANVRLREMQWEFAAKGNPALLIFLGKQYLGQMDKVDHTTAGESLKIVNEFVHGNPVSMAAKTGPASRPN